MGRVLLQYTRDTTLPLHIPQLTLLLASLLQFATSLQEFVRVQLRNGLCIVVSVDTAASAACAVIYASNTPVQDEQARLTSLVVLREFLTAFRDTVARVVEQNRADAERMAEAYTLTSALEGGATTNGGGVGDGVEGEDGEGTMETFVGFENDVVRRLLETADAAMSSTVEAKQSNVKVLRCYLMNAETGVSLTQEEETSTTSDAIPTTSYGTRQLVRRAAHALQLAVPVLKAYSTVTSTSIHATTLVLRLKTASSPTGFDVMIEMYEHGVFAAIVHYASGKERFRGHECEMLRDGVLYRRLLEDPHGAPLARLLHEAEASPSFALHVSADGVPPEALAAALHAWRPWTLSPPTDR